MLGDPEKRGSRDPERTRERLLKAGFREVYRSGFQSASIDTILAAANVTKGALLLPFREQESSGTRHCRRGRCNIPP
jgi:AcrR family transcriptional regulator